MNPGWFITVLDLFITVTYLSLGILLTQERVLFHMVHGLHVPAFIADGRNYPIPRCYLPWWFVSLSSTARVRTLAENFTRYRTPHTLLCPIALGSCH